MRINYTLVFVEKQLELPVIQAEGYAYVVEARPRYCSPDSYQADHSSIGTLCWYRVSGQKS